jgi:hypothetical protein
MSRSPTPFRTQLAATALLVALAPTVLWAQGGAPGAPAAAHAGLTETLVGEAKDDYGLGRILFENGDFAGALVKFQRAYDLSSDFRLLWNMGACEKNLRHYTRVLKLVDQYLHDGDTRISEAQRADAANVLNTVRALVGSIRLVVNEPGASVFLDDEPAGTTPLDAPLLADLGDRRVRVSKPGFREQVLVQHVTGASESTVTVALVALPVQAHLLVSTDATAGITLDGVGLGVGRWDGPVGAGPHTIRVIEPGMHPFSLDFAVAEGEFRRLDVTLERESQGGIPAAVWWIGGGILAAAGLGVGAYFLFRPSPSPTPPTEGTISPGTITVNSFR